MASTNVENKPVGEIEEITGNNRILLIAPHGFNGDKTNGLKADDKNTGILTRQIATRLNCYAIINEVYKKPEKSYDPEKGREIENSDPKNKRINLNRQNQVEEHLKKEFLQPLKNFTQSIIKKHGSALVFWIHGIKDKNITNKIVDGEVENTHVVLGIGQGNSDGHITAKKKTVDDLTRVLRDNEDKRIVAALANEASDYCGAHKNIMNQYFRTHGHDLSVVESIQMEIKHSGFRNEENIDQAAEAFSTAFSKLIEPMPLVKPETEPDIILVERAYSTLAQIVSVHYQNAMIEAGQFIIKEFYGNDIERARDKDPICKESLNQLIQRLHAKDNGGPSKSWVYNAVNLVVQENDLEGFHTYGKLALSQKVLLFPVDDMETKKHIITETVDEKLNVRELRERIKGIKSKKSKSENKGSLHYLIRKPEILFSKNLSAKIESRSLLNVPFSSLERLQESVQGQIKEIEKSIRDLQSHLTQYQVLMGQIEVAKEHKPQKSCEKPKRPKSKYQDWAYEAVSFCNGCLNDCIYCFSKGDAIAQKHRLTHEQWREGKIRPNDVNKNYGYFKTPIMFPGTHDITDDNFSACHIVLDKLLKAGNRVLVVSKPKLNHIKKICEDFRGYQKNMLFRFTVGSVNDDILKFWEPNAPSYNERKEGNISKSSGKNEKKVDKMDFSCYEHNA